jgi:hypothetical protein
MPDAPTAITIIAMISYQPSEHKRNQRKMNNENSLANQ